jgi:glycosyltransferase involved in cell wall biosynthesis
MARFLIVSAEFVMTGGQDRANYALAEFLADRGDDVHLVAHGVAPELAGRPNVTVHPAAKPLGSYSLGQPMLNLAGREQERRLAPDHTIVNGGNCPIPAVNWVHYVHASWPARGAGSAVRRLKTRADHAINVRLERSALRRATLAIANSELTRRHLIELVGVPADRVETIYLGADPSRFYPAGAEERAAIRARNGWDDGRPLLAFVGALGDVRKGFDRLFEAWSILASGPDWDARLVVVGRGASLPAWQAKVAGAGMGGSVQFLGFRGDVPELLRGLDGLVSPTRYDSYGLNVQEALCCGLPALVSASAGVAERYPEALGDLLIPDPDDAAGLAARILRWREGLGRDRPELESFSRSMRDYTWEDMAARMVRRIELRGG